MFDQSKNGTLEQAELNALGVTAGAYIRDDSGNPTSPGHVTQNIENISWFDGDAFDTLAKGSYTVTLEAQNKAGQAPDTTLTKSIVIDVAGGALSGAQSATDALLAGATVGGAGATLLAGTSNSAAGFQTVEVKDAGGSTLQLGLTARAGKVGQGQTFATTDNVHYAVPTATTDTRFAYSIASDGIDLKDVDLKLKIDVDSSSATSFKTFSRSNAGEWVLDSDPAIKITDDARNPNVTQNIENIAWFDNVAGDVLAKGSYDVVLQAFDKGGLIPVIENRIVLDVDGGAPTGGGGTTTPPVVPVDPIDPTPDNDFNEAAASSSVFSFFAGEAPTPEKQAELEAFANMQYEAYAAMGVANPALGPYEALGLGFSETAEFIEKYGAQTESDFISSNYTAVFGHDATPEQLAHFQAQIDYFESLYETNGQSSNMADLHAKGAALGQMLGHAALSQFDMV